MNTVALTRPSSPWVPVGLLLISMTSIQGGAALAKSLFPSVGAAGATALRLGMAMLLLGLLLRPWRVRVARAQWPALLGYGVSLGLMNLMFYQALETVPLGIAIALEFTGPLLVAVAGSRRLREFGWVALAVLGLALLLPVGQLGGAPVDLKGAAFALGAGLCWALYIVFGQRAGAEHGPQTVALGVAIAAGVAVPFGVAHAGAALLSPALLPLGLGVAILSTAVPYSLEMVALTRLPARTFGMLMSLEPAVGALSGLLFLHEQLGALQWLAIAFIIVASLGTAMSPPPPGSDRAAA